MPCYEMVVLARPDVTAERLSALFRSVARVVYREHGQFRRVVNFGVRPLAHAIRTGGSKFEEARWVHATMDIAPTALVNVSAAARQEKGVLRLEYLRRRDTLGEFKPSGRRERVKAFSYAMRYNAPIFDPASVTVQRAGTPGAAAAVARAASLTGARSSATPAPLA